MIRINQLKISIDHTEEDLRRKAAKLLHIAPEEILSLDIVRRSPDARKKDNILFSYIVDVRARNEEKLVKRAKSPDIMIRKDAAYHFPESGNAPLKHRPVIIGFGPAGMFCALFLARAGYHPLVLERGQDADTRKARVARFWETGELDGECNIQFGEGGAGTFSDGKLNTMVKDASGRNRQVLEELVRFGADSSVLWDSHPHVGTDVLTEVVKNIRGEICRLGGEIRFGARADDFITENGKITGVLAGGELIPADVVVFAAGHSARDTFCAVHRRGIPMEAKAFAIGVRIQHPQEMINISQYGMADPGILGPAPYKVTCRARSGRGVYSFCMCPGGYVVNASSEQGMTAVNGMSYHDRGGKNANSAIIVTVGPEDFPGGDVLSGMEFQRNLERAAFRAGEGAIPVQLFGDYSADRISRAFGGVEPAFRGQYRFGDVRGIFPASIAEDIGEGIRYFGRRIRGFDRDDAILAGVESRTSSPVRILRGESLQSETEGFYPCGEGAGYAGGITSAAMDGMRIAEAVAAKYRP
ncbi:MAG: FAD-dependent oxidoreductase [Clostridium sp.]|nr:FAD-dependent oxidoreductase [Clostridium sp.]